MGRTSRALASYLRAGHPYLALRTREEHRALELLTGLCGDAGRRLVPLATTSLGRSDAGPAPKETLEQIARHGDEGTVFALLDFHPWMTDPMVVRALRDLAARLEHRGQSVVFVSPDPAIPDELRTEIVVLDLPPPDDTLLHELLDEEQHRTGTALDPSLAQRAVRAVQGLPAHAARRAFRRACLDPDELPAGRVAGLVDEKRRMLHRTELLEFVDTPPGLDAIGGLDALKSWLRDREAAFGDEARRFGLPAPRGLLLVGVQGCGKSLTAKAVAHAWQLPIVRLDFTALFTRASSPEENLRRALQLVEALAPIVLWIDEIDQAFHQVKRGAGGGEELHRLFAAFVTWMQEKSAPAFVVATANEVEALPPELSRKGRFDEVFFVDLPNRSERARILEVHLRGHGRAPGTYDVETLADSCAHFSGAELEQVVVAGLHRAFRAGRELGDADLRTAAESIVPLYRTYENEIKALREWARTRARRATTDPRLTNYWVDAD